MKRVMTVLLAAMMLFGGLHLVAAEEIIDTVVPEETLAEEIAAEEPAVEETAEAAAETEVPAEESARDELAAVEPVEELVVEEAAEEPAQELVVEVPVTEPVAEPVEEVPAQEPVAALAEEAPVVEVPVQEPVAEPAAVAPAQEPVAAPAEEAPAQEPVAEPVAEVPAQESVPEEATAEQTEVQPIEEAAASFTGTLKARTTEESAVKGETTYVVAFVTDANMGYSIQWELKVDEEWEAIKEANVAKYEFIADMPAGSYNYRAVLTAEDGTVLTDNVIVTVVEPEAEETETETAEVDDIEDYDTALGIDPYQTIVLGDEEEILVREGADGLAAVFTSLPAGAEVTVVHNDGEWSTVIVNGELGYIYSADIAAYLEQEEMISEKIADPPKKVTIFTSRRTIMEEGEQINLTSKLEGFEECEDILYIWKVDKGNGFEVIDGANEDHYSFTATEESLAWDWHLTVLYR